VFVPSTTNTAVAAKGILSIAGHPVSCDADYDAPYCYEQVGFELINNVLTAFGAKLATS
jgi:hypothetical protein